MTAVNHALTGAVIGASLSNPLLVSMLAVISHYACDAVPHFGSGQGLFEPNKTLLFKVVGATDALLLVILYVLLVSTGFSWLVIVGALSAVSPDIAWAYRFIREIRSQKATAASKLTQFHANIQWSETSAGLSLEVIYGVAMAGVLFFMLG